MKCAAILLLCVSALAQPLPVFVQPPPPTNRYYVRFVWDSTTNHSPAWAFDILYGPNTNASNFIASGPQFCGSTGCIVSASNLIYGTTNWFKGRLKYGGYGVTNWFYEPFYDLFYGTLRDFSDPVPFPPPQPPLTNFIWVGATNWTGRLFANPLPMMQFYRMRATNLATGGWELQGFNSLNGQWLKLADASFSVGTKPYLLIVSSNNQINLKQFMHKQ